MRLLLAVLLLCAITLGAESGDSDPQPAAALPLASRDLESLLSTPVTTVRRREQSLSRTAGAVYVITRDELRRFGVSSLAEALRLVPGIDVSRIGLSSWAISARGFNNAYANKLLVMIDGRTVYTPAFGGVFWDQQDTLIEDIDRIEVLRGPGAAMWGANAVNGVINVITKPASRTQGTLVTMGGGTEDLGLIRMRHGAAAGRNGYYRFYGQQTLRVGAGDGSGRVGNARWSMLQAGMRGDWTFGDFDTLTVQADSFRSGALEYAGIPTLRSPFLNIVDSHSATFGGNFLTRWEHTHRKGGLSAFQAYFDSYSRGGVRSDLTVNTLDMDYQYRHPAWGRHEFGVAFGVRVLRDELRPLSFMTFDRGRQTYGIEQFTVQDDITLAPNRVAISAAARVERNTFTGLSTQPTVRLLYTPTSRHTFWAALSRSVRTPARGELGVDFLAQVIPKEPYPVLGEIVGQPGLRNEVGTSFEGGYRGQWGKRFTVDTSVFASRLTDLLGIVPDAPVLRFDRSDPYLLTRLRYRNSAGISSYGVEASARYSITPDLQIVATVNWLKFARPRGLASSPSDPMSTYAGTRGWQDSIRLLWKPARSWEVDTFYFGYGPRINVPDGKTRHRLDLRIGRRLTESADISAGVQGVSIGTRLETMTLPLHYLPAPLRTAVYLRLGVRF
ncbi:MAG: TonB-dependent receptor plug domain-containing protein [Bryobacterales bacterium]|nr:TonB-dependent receptor plug domain-containing protein [Bryobacterales bacterium]